MSGYLRDPAPTLERERAAGERAARIGLKFKDAPGRTPERVGAWRQGYAKAAREQQPRKARK